jgi:hypothetical protein
MGSAVAAVTAEMGIWVGDHSVELALISLLVLVARERAAQEVVLQLQISHL